MQKTRFSVLILVIIALLCTCFTACDNTPADTSSAAESSLAPVESSAAEESLPEERVLFDNLPDVNYNDEEFVFLVEGDHQSIYKSIDIMPHEASSELINEAVIERNNLVEERFGVKIKEIRTSPSEAMITLIRSNHDGGTDLYDVVCPYVPAAASLALEGFFYDMTDYENMHLDESYWDQTGVKDMSIAGHVYFSTGDMNIVALGCTHALVFNKDIIENNKDLPNPYQLVKDGQWTLDKLYEMGRAVTADSDGVTGMTSTDTYGFILNQNYPTSMYLGSGERLTKKDSEDMPMISIKSSRGESVTTKIFDIVNDKACTASIESFSKDVSSRGKADIWQLATAMVAEGNCLFRALAVIDIADLGAYQCNFGILPTPKFNDEQENYISNVSVVLASCNAIPKSNSEPEKAAIILDAICQASTDTTRYSYYEVLLKNRKIQDDDSELMLDYIFNSRVFDLGIVYQWGGINNVINTIVWSGSNTYTSSIDGIMGTIEEAMGKTKEFMK